MNRILPVLALLLMPVVAMPNAADQTPLADLSDPQEAKKWRFFTDQVMGGRSTGTAELRDNAVRLQGAVSTANNGGFIQIRRETRNLPQDATALVLSVRGDGQTYFVHLRTTATRLPWQYYQLAFTAPEEWSTITLPFDKFKASGPLLPKQIEPDSIRSIGLVAYGREHVADVSLSSVTVQ